MSTASAVFVPIKQSLTALRDGQETFAKFVVDLFSDLDAMQHKLREAQLQLLAERNQLKEERDRIAQQQPSSSDAPAVDETLKAKVAELESDRTALEEELESVRAHAVDMAQTLSDQKRQMAEEHAEWAAELRQLRRILDKQAAWITQHAEMGAGPWGGDSQFGAGANGSLAAAGPAGRAHPTAFPAANATSPARQPDPVVGSILSQFELLQKDVARRRGQTDQDRAKG